MISIEQALSDQNTAPTVLAHLLLEAYDRDWLLLEPIVLWEKLKEDHGVELTRAQKDKIMSTRIAIRTDQPLKEYPVFFNTCLAFNGLRISPETPTLPTHEMIAWTLSELKDIGGDPLEEDLNIHLTPAVKGAICAVLMENGIAYVPADQSTGELLGDSLMGHLMDYNPEAIKFAIDAENDYKHVAETGESQAEPGSPVAIHTIKLLLVDMYVQQQNRLKEEALNVV